MHIIQKFIRDHGVKSVLDIGANVGHYSKFLKHSQPELDIFMLEANMFCGPYLEGTGIPYEIACLSNKEKQVQLFVNPKNVICTGTSYYQENTHHYDESSYINVNTRKLDDVLKKRFGEQKLFDFIKLDTQGSELDILDGGALTRDAAKHIQLEVSLIEYNKGAPLKDQVFKYMETHGFKPNVMVEIHHWEQNPNNNVIQEDWIFSRV
jgi:FkbM family methyltransferase